MAYSVDLRTRIVAAVVEHRKTIAETAKTFEVGTATVERYLRRYREKKSLRPGTSPGRPSGLAKREGLLQEQLTQANDLRLEERCKAWEAATGKQVSSATMSRWLRKVGVTRKKRP